ncbi:EH domain-containing protein 1-like [Lolium perenne]|uniref:EH domain-containing protein 1-like n=1 Tax=Lolium perenne TaxID=4522 RepID=UPI003A9A5495
MEIGAASSCYKEHQKIYHDWFAFADSDGDGRISGPDAIKFFGMSRLPRADLKQVWAIADSKRLGYLGFGEFVTAMQVLLATSTSPSIILLPCYHYILFNFFKSKHLLKLKKLKEITF